MSLNIKGQKCVVCKSELSEKDDIVYCPVCSAPHHRECYKSVGHCGLEHLHGTDKEFSREETPVLKENLEEKTENSNQKEKANPFPKRLCPSCKKEIPFDTRFCPFCGLPVTETVIFETPNFDKNAEIEKGVKAIDAAKVVFVNPFRYIAKFLKLNEKHKISWNWAAFLVPGGWFAWRKMYKESVIATAFLVIANLFNIPFNLALQGLPVSPEGTSILSLLDQQPEYIQQIGSLPILLMLIGVLINAAVHIITALYGDWFYKQYVVDAVAKIKTADNAEFTEAKYSGTSFIGFLIAFAACDFLPTLISMLITL